MRQNNDIICHCEEITYEAIENAIKNGADTIEKIQDQTSAGIACGYCIEILEEILEEFLIK